MSQSVFARNDWGEMSSEIPSGNVVTPAARRPSASTHKYCGLLRCSHVRRTKGKVGGTAECRRGKRQTKRSKERKTSRRRYSVLKWIKKESEIHIEAPLFLEPKNREAE